jgi:hypothetical protein
MTTRQQSTDAPADGVRDLAASLAAQIALANATACARRGDYAEAENALADAPETPEVLDLRARILAQQQRFQEAAALWGRASEMVPQTAAYRDARDRAARDALRGKPSYSLWPTVGAVLVGAAVVALLALAAVYAVRIHRDLGTTQASLAAIEARLSAQEGKADALAESVGDLGEMGASLDQTTRQLDEQSSAIEELQTGQQNLLTALQPSAARQPVIMVEGVTTIDRGDRFDLLFDEGLFAHGTILKPEALAQLENLAAQLEPLALSYDFVLFGYTDDMECAHCAPGILSLARSAKLLEVLLSHTSLLRDQITIAAPQAGSEPFPNDSTLNRQRNRTVIITLVPKGS